MTTIQWRPVVNALTKPQSYRPQFVPRGTAGYDEMAADISAANPVYNADLLRAVAPLIMDWIQERMINGWHVTFEDAFTFHPSLNPDHLGGRHQAQAERCAQPGRSAAPDRKQSVF